MYETCRRAAPAEACGLLAGRGSIATAHYPVANVALRPAERFEMDPHGQMEAFAAMERRGEELVAIYHSHPSTGAVPSRADILSANYPHAFYLIVGLPPGGPRLRAYRIYPQARTAVEVRWLEIRAR